MTTAQAVLDLPGEVVSGHPDRHVVRVDLPGWGAALYLKRQHRIGWRERLRQRFTGFGWASRCEREQSVLRDLETAGFPGPAWVACGEDGRGRAFLLVEELDGIELRKALGDGRLSSTDRTRLAERFGLAVAELHAAGFDTPDLTAKHAFLDPTSRAVTFIDWQSARRVKRLEIGARARALAALHASLADHLAGPRERLRFLWAYRRVVRRAGLDAPRFSALAREIARLAAVAGKRRSIRDQRQPGGTGDLRLVWLAGEAVCAVPDVAATWPAPVVAPPFYGDPTPSSDGSVRITLPDGRPAELVCGAAVVPLGRFLAWVRSRPWRSPGATLGRVLFHLQRYGIPAPRLLAFGQRETGRVTADWFALHEPPGGRPLAAPAVFHRDVFAQAGQLLRQLHDAGCRYAGPGPLFRVAADGTGRVSVGGVRTVRIARRLTLRVRRADLRRIVQELPATRTDRLRVLRGYFGPRWAADPFARQTARTLLGREARR